MDAAVGKRIQELCSRIAVEQDRGKFLKLCEELNRLLSSRDQEPEPEPEDKPGGPRAG